MISNRILQYLYKPNRLPGIVVGHLSRWAEGDHLLSVQLVFGRSPPVELHCGGDIGESIQEPMAVAQPCCFAGITADDIGSDQPPGSCLLDAKPACSIASPQRSSLAPQGLRNTNDCIADPAVRALRARVVFEEDPAAPIESATVTVQLADGTEHREHIVHGRGTPDRPMSNAELDTKVRELTTYGAPFVDAARLIAAVRGIQDESDPTRLMRLTVPT